MGREARRREAAEAVQLANEPARSEESLTEYATPTGVTEPTSSLEVKPLQPFFQANDATTAPELPVTSGASQGQGQTHLTATTAGAIMAFLTGGVKPVASIMLLVALLLSLFWCLWMLATDNQLGRLIWPTGYIDFAYKVGAVVALIGGAVVLGFIGYVALLLFKLVGVLFQRITLWLSGG